MIDELEWCRERHRPTMNRHRARDLSREFYYAGLKGMSELMDACHAVFQTAVVDIDVKHYGCAQDHL